MWSARLLFLCLSSCLVNIDSFVRVHSTRSRYCCRMATKEVAPTGVSIAGFSLTSRVLNDGGNPPETPKDAATIVKDLRVKILALYGQYMSPDGRSVNYEALGASDQFSDFVRLAQELKWVQLAPLSEVERRACLINIYNSLVVHGLVVGPVPQNLLGRLNFYSTVSYNISGNIFSLDDIEHGLLRGNRATLTKPTFLGSTHFADSDPRAALAVPLDPRIHMALNCGAKGCPPIRYYEGASLQDTLDLAARGFLRGVEVDSERAHLKLSQIMKWYQRDFGDGSVRGMLAFILPYLPDSESAKLKALLDDPDREIEVEHEPYDWSLNEA